jgi:hypothetical protein
MEIFSMIKNLFISLLAVIAFAIPSSAGPPSVQRQARDGDTAVDFGMMTVDFNTGNTAGIYNLGFSYPLFSLDWSNGAGGFNAGLYVCDTQNGGGVSPLSGTTQCVSVSTLQTTDLTVESFKSKKRYIVIDIISAGTGRLTIKGSWDQISDAGAVEFDQPNPTPESGQQLDGVTMNLWNPATVSAGYGVSYGANNPIPDDPSGGTFAASPAGEPDNMIGQFYNKTGVNGNPVNPYEHAMDDSYELAFRATATGDKTWLENNIDFFAPANQVVVSAGSFNPAVGSTVTFDFNNSETTENVDSSESWGYVTAWDSGTRTLTWIQDYGDLTNAPNPVTVTDASSNTATFDESTVVHKNNGLVKTDPLNGQWRYRQMEWKTTENRVSNFWVTNPLAQDSILRMGYYDEPVSASVAENGMAHQNAAIEYNGNPGSSLNIGINRNNVYALNVRSQTLGRVISSALPTGKFDPTGSNQWQQRGLVVGHDFGEPIYYGGTTAIQIAQPTASSATAKHNSLRYGLHIQNQQGYGSGGAVIQIDAQDCSGGGLNIFGVAGQCRFGQGTYGNLVVGGGDWNSGHIAFTNTNASGDHLYRDQTDEVLRITTDAYPRHAAEAAGSTLVIGDQILTGALTTADPCGTKPEAYVFYNDNAGSEFYCYCDSTTTAKRMHDPATACF